MRMFRSVRTLVLASLMLAAPLASFAGIFFSVNIGPPELPVYEQPICPGDGYIWTPGYWAYGDEGYFWVPGTWVMAPRVGYLWTPGYWGWGGNAFLFHQGYWGEHIGFYGGVNYGHGYGGHGYEGGYWEGGHFSYNRYVNHVDEHSVHIYNKVVINNVTVNRVSYNGGKGGIAERARPEEMRAEHEQHVQATAVQTQHVQAASTNRAQFASVNHGHPTVAATPRPGAFNERGAVAAHGGAAANLHANEVNRGPAANHPGVQGAGRPMVASHPNGAMTNGNRPAYNGNANRPLVTAHSNGAQGQHNPRTEPTRPTPQYSQHQAPAVHQNSAPREYSAPHQNAAPREYSAPHQNPAPRAYSAPHETAPHSAPHAQSAPRGEPHAGGQPKGGHEPHGRR